MSLARLFSNQDNLIPVIKTLDVSTLGSYSTTSGFPQFSGGSFSNAGDIFYMPTLTNVVIRYKGSSVTISDLPHEATSGFHEMRFVFAVPKKRYGNLSPIYTIHQFTSYKDPAPGGESLHNSRLSISLYFGGPSYFNFSIARKIIHEDDNYLFHSFRLRLQEHYPSENGMITFRPYHFKFLLRLEGLEPPSSVNDLVNPYQDLDTKSHTGEDIPNPPPDNDLMAMGMSAPLIGQSPQTISGLGEEDLVSPSEEEDGEASIVQKTDLEWLYENGIIPRYPE